MSHDWFPESSIPRYPSPNWKKARTTLQAQRVLGVGGIQLEEEETFGPIESVMVPRIRP